MKVEVRRYRKDDGYPTRNWADSCDTKPDVVELDPGVAVPAVRRHEVAGEVEPAAAAEHPRLTSRIVGGREARLRPLPHIPVTYVPHAPQRDVVAAPTGREAIRCAVALARVQPVHKPRRINPPFPALRSGPTAVSGAGRQKQIPTAIICLGTSRMPRDANWVGKGLLLLFLRHGSEPCRLWRGAPWHLWRPGGIPRHTNSVDADWPALPR
jgi:hypothetical protein